MPKSYTIMCPFHQEEETLTLSDSYSNMFEGEVPCGGPEEVRATLRIKVLKDQIMELEIVGRPSGRSVDDYYRKHPKQT